MTALLLAAQWVHLTLCVLLTGSFCVLLLAGQPETAIMRQWERGVLRWTRLFVFGTMASGIVVMAAQTAQFEDRPTAALQLHAILRATLETRLGFVWMVRQGLLLVLAVFLVLSREDHSGATGSPHEAKPFC